MEQLPIQQVFNYGGTNHVTINNNPSNPFSEIEPFTEPVTIKLGETSKKQLIKMAQKCGYTNLSVFLRDMIKIGTKVYPHLNKTLSDILS